MRRIYFLACLLLMPVLSAYGVEIDGIEFNLNDSYKTAKVKAKSSGTYTDSIVIPSQVTYNGVDYSVTSIGDYAFYGCSGLTSITIPEGITSIGDYAFYGCSSLTSISIPESVTSIGEIAFYGCSSLTSITIPESVTSIGEFAFDDTPWFNNKPDGVIYIGTLAYCYKGEMPDDTEIVLKEGTKSICNYAFYFGDNYNLISITIPEGVTSIGDYAFSYSNLTSINIPSGVEIIGEGAFEGCRGLTTISIPESIKSIGKYVFDDTPWFNNKPDGLMYIGKVAYRYKGAMPSGTEIVLKEGTTEIALGAFYGCYGLKSITIPNSVISIEYEAFAGCSGLTSINIPEGVTSIGYGAFSGCSGLTSINIPEGVTSIGSRAFSDCSGLTSITIPESVANISLDSFSGCTALNNVKVTVADYTSFCSNSIIGLIKYYLTIPVQLIDSNGNEIKQLIIPEGVTTISNSAFCNCTGLSSVTIPNSVTSIGDQAFLNCQLNSLTVGTGLLSIGSNAFNNKPIKTIWLANTPPSGYSQAIGLVNYAANDQYSSIRSIKVYPFLSSMFVVDGIKYVPVSPSERTCDAIDCCYDSTSVNVIIPKTTTYRGIDMTVSNVQPYLCYGNTYIKKASATNESDLSDYAFSRCTSLDSINIANKGSIGSYAFVNCSSLKKAYISNKGDIAQQAFSGCTSLDAVIIANEGNIGLYAFENCSSLKKADISNKGNIGQYAFSGCASLGTVKLANEGYIGSCVFSGCTSLDDINIDIEGDIKYGAFQNCRSLKEIELLIKGAIGTSAFSGCTSLGIVKFGDNVGSIGDYSFANCSSLVSLTTPDSAVVIGEGAFSGCSSLDTIVIKKGITSIGDNAFTGCSSLTTLLINDGDAEKVLTLGSKGSSPLFADCPLDSVYIGRNIEYNTAIDHGYSPFYRNTRLRSVLITDMETEISENEFYGCTNLKNVIVGDGVTKIGERAFSGCASLEKFSFGADVDIIGKEAFSDCIALTEIKSFAVVPPVCGNQALDDINKWDCTLSVPEISISDYQAADQWKEFFFIVKNDDYADAVYQIADRKIDVRVGNGAIIISGLNDGELISLYEMDGNLISTKAAINGTVQISIADIAKGTQLIIRIGKNARKIMVM